MIVMKFGGTSTQDAKAQSNVASIIHNHVHLSPVVVISAIAKGTNYLERAGKFAEQGNSEEAIALLTELFARHYQILETNVQDSTRKKGVLDVIQHSFNELKELVRGVSILRELTPRTLDAFYCFGELLSSRLIAATCQEKGIDAVWLDTKEFMVTEANHNRAMPIMELVQEKLSVIALPLIRQGKVIVTQGFIGITQNGFRTTMGRESSDYSATIIGAALNADEIQIWTDVDGILTADPRVVSSPKKVKTMLPEEAFELSYFGAKVLHANSMLPALEKNIPVSIRNSMNPSHDGTKVTTGSNTKSCIKSIAYKNNVSVITLSPYKRYGQFIFWEHVYNILTKYDVTANVTTTSEFNVALALDSKYNLTAIVHELSSVGKITMFDRKGIVCVVGFGIQQTPEFLSRIFASLQGMKLSVISFGASKSSITLVLNEQEVEHAVRQLHREFFEGEIDVELFEQNLQE
ncbi:MAG: aspartate kinase [Ignavibacteriae bacterium]|nr:aspartate kinase [Ignavibacteriota bacterium]